MEILLFDLAIANILPQLQLMPDESIPCLNWIALKLNKSLYSELATGVDFKGNKQTVNPPWLKETSLGKRASICFAQYHCKISHLASINLSINQPINQSINEMRWCLKKEAFFASLRNMEPLKSISLPLSTISRFQAQ